LFDDDIDCCDNHHDNDIGFNTFGLNTFNGLGCWQWHWVFQRWEWDCD
jgi:hypothetical protein